MAQRLYVLALTDAGAEQFDFPDEASRNVFLSTCDDMVNDWYTLDVDLLDGSIEFSLATTGPDALEGD